MRIVFVAWSCLLEVLQAETNFGLSYMSDQNTSNLIGLIDAERIEQRLNELWAIGKTNDSGVTRLAYTEEENNAFQYLTNQLSSDFTITEDSIGNVFATANPDAERTLLLGSHLDSVFNAGRLDGALGVVTALEAIEASRMIDPAPSIAPTLVIFRAEESTRFGQHTIGSRGALGLLTMENFSAVDQSGIPLWYAMQQSGFQPSNLSEPTFDLNRIVGFLEVHIEQGRVLDEAADSIGIVSGIRAPVRYQVTVIGDDDHSGATPMDLRRDAIGGAAEMVATVERRSSDASEMGDLVGTVGDINAIDGAINKVCGKVTYPIDIRSNDQEYRDEFEETLLNQLQAVAADRDLDLDLELVDRSAPAALDESIQSRLVEFAGKIDTSYQQLPSGGGHDAMNFQKAGIPTGMIFTPSIDGISHNPREETTQEAIRDATAILTAAIVEGVS